MHLALTLLTGLKQVKCEINVLMAMHIDGYESKPAISIFRIFICFHKSQSYTLCITHRISKCLKHVIGKLFKLHYVRT